MPFTPKFVDLVRNSTSVTGTGPVTLGSAISGFTGLAAALSVGEQFYYCIQGVDKPAEREVGRGTMQANGTIARQPISGALTNFTTGAKTIAMVAAAEWFARLEEVANSGGGGGGAAFDVATRAALAARTLHSGGVQLTEAGREGLFTFSTANLAAKVAADVRQGIYVAPSSDPSGASGAWVRKFDGAVNVMWFGAKADFVTDDLPAFEAALGALATHGGGRLLVNPGTYYCSATLNLHATVQIIGGGSGQNGGNGTIIRFGKNCNGIVVNHGNTHGDGTGTQGLAATTAIQGLQLWGGNLTVNASGTVTNYAAGDSPSGHGVRIRTAFVRLIDVACLFWGGDGFNIVCTAGSGGATEGNANSFYLEACQAQYNRGNGYLLSGSDANAGTVNTCSAISNGGCGFKEYSFLGNSYIQCHARDNGVSDPTGSNGPTGMCSYGGLSYYVVAGQEAAASTTVPGTNTAVWRTFSGHPAEKAWVSGLTWQLGAPYATNPANVNARNVFMGCYGESAQSPVQATYPSLFLGGLLEEVGFDGSATWLIAGNGGLISSTGFKFQNSANTLQIAQEGGKEALYHQIGAHNYRIGAGANGQSIARVDDNSVTTESWGLANDTGGYGPFHHWIRRLFIGHVSGADGLQLGGISSTADLNGRTVRKGSRFYFDSPAAGGAEGVVITAGGTVGVDAVFTPFGLIGDRAVNSQAGTAYTAVLADAQAYVRFTSASAVTCTVPASSAVAFPIGTVIEVEQAGAGAVTIAPGAGVTVNSRGGDLTLAGQYAVAALKKVAADSWTLTGDL